MKIFIRALSIITVFITLLAFSSCSEEFLKKEPKGVAAGSVMTTPDGIESILTGTYAALKGRYMFGGALGTDWVYGSVTSDDSYKGTSAGDSSFIPTDHLLDPRVDWTIARRGVDFLGWGIHPGMSWIREQSNGGPYMTKKYMHFKSEQSLNLHMKGFYNGKNYRMYRLANILLWRAEVAIEQGDLDLAWSIVNQIRERAKNSTPVMGLCLSYANLGSDPVVDWTQPAANYKIEPYPPGHPAFSSQTEARKAVRMEIRLEFATEGHRFFDLRRWDIDDEVLNDFIARDLTFRPTMRWAIYDPVKNDYWPLPQSQVDMQKKVLQQDPSYVN